MQRGQIEAEHIIERYLADQLSEDEVAAFEEFCQKNPEIYRDIEATLRFREGLAVLRERGRLQTVLRAPPRRLWVSVAAAAAVLLAAVGLWTARLKNPSPPTASKSPILSASSAAAPILGTFVLVTQRGPHSQAALSVPRKTGAVVLKILPSDFTHDGHYAATLLKQDATGAQTPVTHVDDLKPTSDRYVTLYLNPIELPPGDYELTLSGMSPTQTTVADHFALSISSHDVP
jgi:hypothetical protein